MSEEFEEKLIKCVKQHQCLYNKTDFGFRQRHKRDKAWANVAAVCRMPVKQCQCRWKTLRDRYVREYHKTGAALETEEPAVLWRYYEQLGFLQKHIKLRGTCEEDSQLEFDDESLMEQDSPANLMEEIPLRNSAQGLEQAHTEFLKVMTLLEKALKKKLDEEPKSSAMQKDPFYKYLESILSRVDESTRNDIQFKLLNLANTEVKNATK